MISRRISYHGGHSGQYCTHARDRLEDIVLQYIRLGFSAVGITEHIPPPDDRFLYPDEKAANLTAESLLERFGLYFKELDHLKKKYADRIVIYRGMETETVTGYQDHVRSLIKKFQPDYIVGSVHHIDDLCFDYSKEAYEDILARMGSHEAMYARYFDLQYEMIKALSPFVVGHFDLIRIFDDNYEKRIEIPQIKEKIIRNLELIKSLGLVMDFNLRPLAKGKKEPYIAPSILRLVKKMGIRAVPGDDSHGVDEAGCHVDTSIQILMQYGFDTRWPEPKMLQTRH